MKELHILNLGAGVQSTTLYLMWMQGVIESPLDAAIFADTQEEPQDVYAHLEWLRCLPGAQILVRSRGRLGDDILRGGRYRKKDGKSWSSIPAFTADEGGKTGVLRRQCSREYKTQVIEQTIRRELAGAAPGRPLPRDCTVTQYIGISLDEAGRAKRLIENRGNIPQWKFRFPLIERNMTRADCLSWLEANGSVPHKVPRSACVFCPYHTDNEWHDLRHNGHEADWQRAVEIDKAIRPNRMHLHKSCQPIELVQLNLTNNPRAAQLGFSFWAECEGVCGV